MRSFARYGVAIGAVAILTLALVSNISRAGIVGADGGMVVDLGSVGTRAIVFDENGNPVLAEYDSNDGDFIREVTELARSNRYVFMSGKNYRALLVAYAEYRSEHDDDVAAGALLLTPDEYRSQFPDGPQLYAGTRSVLTRNPERVAYSLLNRDPILFEAPVDLRSGSTGVPVDDDAMSLVLNENGQVLYASPNRIGYRTAYHKPREGGEGDPARDDEFRRRTDEVLRGPLAGVRVQGGVGYNFITATGENGQFALYSYIPPCPGFEFHYQVRLDAFVPYTTFNPQAPMPRQHMVFRSVPIEHTCFGYSALLQSSGSLIGLLTAINIESIIASIASPIYNVNIPVDIALVQAKGRLSNADGSRVWVGSQTRYKTYVPASTEYRAPKYLDLDGDKELDWIGAPAGSNGNEGSVYADGHPRERQVMVVLGGRPAGFRDGLPVTESDTVMAHIFRRADVMPDMEDRALLDEISSEDLAKTDLYVVRTATGHLVMKREGLSERFIDADNGEFSLDIPIPGGAGAFAGGAAAGGLEAWQARTGLTDRFTGRLNSVDSLRPGETLTLVAINRPTGYIGLSNGVLGASATSSSGLLTAKFENLTLQPPNLKISAHRVRKDDEEFQIGFEGSALTDDNLIQVTSEWAGPNGEVIPEEIDGYTGRLAKITASNVLTPASMGGDDVGYFNIEPGIQQQILKFKGDILGPEHFYLHVSGNSEYTASDFSSGEQSGILRYRPNRYVPFRVALHDEFETAKARYETETEGGNAEDVDPLYHWPYRPEMQFSVFELEQVALRENNEDGSTRTLDLRNVDETAVLNLLETLALDLLYNIGAPEFDPLAPFGPERQLAFSLGGNEIIATIGESGELTFGDPDFINGLVPGELLTLQLMQDNDAANILWEIPVEYLYLGMRIVGYDLETEDTVYVTADDPELPLQAILVGYTEREPEDKTPVSIKWTLEGPGSFTVPAATDSDMAVFDTDLQMDPVKGNRALVRATLSGSDGVLTEAKYKMVEVLAGKPANIEVSVDGEAVAMEAGDLTVAAFVTDQHGNYVEDGTSVNIEVSGDSIIKAYSTATVGGWAEIKITGNAFAEQAASLRVTSGSAVKELAFDVRPLNVTFVGGATSIARQGSDVIHVQVTTPSGEAVPDIAVALVSTRGMFEDSQAVTDENGIASAVFHAGLRPGEGEWKARAGYAGGASQAFYVTDPVGGPSVNVDEAMVVGDAAINGMVTYERYDGVNIGLAYETTGAIKLEGEPEAELDIELGDLSDPNLEPLVALYMNDLEIGQNADGSFETRAPDELGFRNAKTSNVAVVHDNPLGAGTSYRLQGDGSITIAADPFLNKASAGFRIDIKPETPGGELLDHASKAQFVELVNGKVRYSVRTTAGTFAVESESLASGAWHTVAGRFRNGTLELSVDGEIYTATATGSIQYGVAPIVLARNFNGNINSFRLYDWNAQPLLNINGATQQTVRLDAQGAASITVGSTGVMGQAQPNSQLGLLRVAVIAEGKRQYVSIISRSTYADVASYYVDSFYPEAPPIAWQNIDPASPSYVYSDRSSLEPFVNFVIPPAHALEFFGVDVWGAVKAGVSWVIPYEDIAMLGKQLYYLATADWENFNAVDLAFGALGTATVIPLAKPLKPFLKPLKAFMKKFGNKPIVKAVAGVLGRAVEEAYKSRKLDKLQKLLPWLLIVAEMALSAEGPEALALMVEAIESTDDLLGWIEYFSLPADGWLSDGAPPAVELTATEPLSVTSSGQMFAVIGGSMLSALVPEAHAAIGTTARRIAGKAMAVTLSKVRQNIDKTGLDPKDLSKIFKEAAESLSHAEFKQLRRYATKADFINACSVIYKQGLNKLRHFIRGDKDTRMRPALLIASIVFLEEAMLNGRIPNDNGQHLKIYSLIAGAFAGSESERAIISRDGSAFHLVMVAYYQALHQFNLPGGTPIKDIETVRPVSYYNGSRAIGLPYNRRVDIILQSGEGSDETWVEVKSKRSPLKSSDFSGSRSRERGIGREFFADWTANRTFRDPIANEMSVNKEIQWRFAQFKTRSGKVGPTPMDMQKARNWLCDMPSETVEFYKDNFRSTSSILATACGTSSASMIGVNKTTTILKDVFLPNNILPDLKDLILNEVNELE